MTPSKKQTKGRKDKKKKRECGIDGSLMSLNPPEPRSAGYRYI